MALRCVYLDLDGTLLGPDGSLLRGADGGVSLLGVRALEACARAGAEVVLFTGRTRTSTFVTARLLGLTSFIYEAGCGVHLDGEDELLVGSRFSPAGGQTVWQRIEASGAPTLLLSTYAGRLEPHTPWSEGRDVSHLYRGVVDAEEATALLAAHGFEGLRLIDNGASISGPHTLEGYDRLRAYHLQPVEASKGAAVARHAQNRGYARSECIGIGDSREDLGAAAAVGEFWLVANALAREPGIRAAASAAAGTVRFTEESYGAGVYEAVITTLAERR